MDLTPDLVLYSQSAYKMTKLWKLVFVPIKFIWSNVQTEKQLSQKLFQLSLINAYHIYLVPMPLLDGKIIKKRLLSLRFAEKWILTLEPFFNYMQYSICPPLKFELKGKKI